jgi:hypothetical protein
MAPFASTSLERSGICGIHLVSVFGARLTLKTAWLGTGVRDGDKSLGTHGPIWEAVQKLGDPVGRRFDEKHSWRSVDDLRGGQGHDPREILVTDFARAGETEDESSHKAKLVPAPGVSNLD